MSVETELWHLCRVLSDQAISTLSYIVKCFALVKCLALRHSSQICSEILANRKHLYEISGMFGIRQIYEIWRLTLRRMLTQSHELK